MIKLGRCRCMAVVYLVEEAGLKWTADPEPLGADEAVQALLAGRELYRVAYVGSTPSRLQAARPEVLAALLGEPGERPVVVPNHECPPGAVRALQTPLLGGSVQPTPQRPSVGRTALFSGPQTGTSSVRSADPRPSDAPRPMAEMTCRTCRKTVLVGEISGARTVLDPEPVSAQAGGEETVHVGGELLKVHSGHTPDGLPTHCSGIWSASPAVTRGPLPDGSCPRCAETGMICWTEHLPECPADIKRKKFVPKGQLEIWKRS